MSNSAKAKIYQMPDGIEDEILLVLLMEDDIFLCRQEDITGELTPEQLQELNNAIQEADNKETISPGDF